MFYTQINVVCAVGDKSAGEFDARPNNSCIDALACGLEII
jgi:hypothetical protein